MSETPWARIRHADGTATDCHVHRVTVPQELAASGSLLMIHPPPGADFGDGDQLERDLGDGDPLSLWSPGALGDEWCAATEAGFTPA